LAAPEVGALSMWIEDGEIDNDGEFVDLEASLGVLLCTVEFIQIDGF
jgi:hypothetical protein